MIGHSSLRPLLFKNQFSTYYVDKQKQTLLELSLNQNLLHIRNNALVIFLCININVVCQHLDILYMYLSPRSFPNNKRRSTKCTRKLFGVKFAYEKSWQSKWD